MADRYLVLSTPSAARDRSHQQALAMGCDPAGVTQYWWDVVEHPTSGQAAVVIADGSYDATGLAAAEATALQPQATLTAANWFPVPIGPGGDDGPAS